MTSAENIETTIRAAMIAKSVLEIMNARDVNLARLHLTKAAKEFNELNRFLAKLQVKYNAKN